jgi:hypothetical protein
LSFGLNVTTLTVSSSLLKEKTSNLKAQALNSNASYESRASEEGAKLRTLTTEQRDNEE